MDDPRRNRRATSDLRRLLYSSGAIQTAGLAVTLLLGIQLARYLGPAGYGTYGLILAVVALVNTPAQFGLPILGLREAGAALANAARFDRADLVRWFLLRSGVIAALVASVMAIAVLAARPHWTAGNAHLAILAAVMVFFSSVSAVAVALLRGFGDNLVGQTVDLLVKPALAVGAIFIAYRIFGGLAVEGAISAQIGAMAIVFLAASCLLRGDGRSKNSAGQRYRPRSWLPAAAALMANSLLFVVNGNYPIVVAGLFASSGDLGIFRVALSSVALLGLPFSIANIAAGPVVARQYAEGDEAGLATTLSHTTLASFALTASGLIVIALFGRFFIRVLFGAEYIGAFPPLLLLGVSQLIFSWFGMTATFLSLSERHALVLRAYIVSVPLGILASLCLSAPFGIDGAAMGTIVMAVAWHVFIFGFNANHVRRPLSVAAALRFAIRERGGHG